MIRYPITYFIQMSIFLFLTGQYGCRASDLGSSHFKTFVVNVVSRPRTNIDPISRTVYKGRQVVIKCISKDDTLGSYEYSWLRDNVPLVPSFNKEVVEELVPTGSRLTLHDAQGSALYTCIVRNQAGHSQINSSIAVMSGNHPCVVCFSVSRLMFFNI